MELLLVRHAEPTRLETLQGRADPPLHERGLQQARRLAAWLAHEEVAALYTSPALRARQTTEVLAERLGLPFHSRDGLDEFDRDERSYVPVEELRASGDPRWEALLRGELFTSDVDPEAFRQRVVETLDEIIRGWPGSRVVAVCHAGVINAYVGAILPVRRAIWFGPGYTSVSRVLAGRDGRRGVRSLNEVAHLHPAAGSLLERESSQRPDRPGEVRRGQSGKYAPDTGRQTTERGREGGPDVAEEARSRAPVDATESWRRSYEQISGAWSDALRDGGRYLDPFGLYRQWLDDLARRREQADGEASAPAPVGPDAFSRQLTETAGETWRRAAGLSAALARLAPHWVELAEEFRKQLLQGGPPSDPLDLVTRWYNATSGPFSAMLRELLTDDAYLGSSRRLLENYATLDTVFRRFSQEVLRQLQVSTSSDTARVASLVVAVDEKIDRLEDALVESDDAAQLRERLARVEEKLDRLLLALPPGDGDPSAAPERRTAGKRAAAHQEGTAP